MKKMFAGLCDFLVGFAKLILICGAMVLLVRELDWAFANFLPLKAIGIPPIVLSIIVVCLIVWIVLSAVEKWIWKSPVKTMTRHEIHEARTNSNRGWLCLMTGVWVWLMTLGMDDTREKLILCAIAAIVAWPV